MPRVAANAVEEIISGLTPYIGELMARAAVENEIRKMKIDAPELAANELDKLIDTLGLGLNVFVGRQKAKDIVEALKTRVHGD
jgi:hypothetical protein